MFHPRALSYHHYSIFTPANLCLLVVVFVYVFAWHPRNYGTRQWHIEKGTLRRRDTRPTDAAIV